MSNEEIRIFLRSSPLLRPLREETIGELASQVRIARWKRNQVVIRKGDPGNAMMIVVTGRMKITSTTENGRECILRAGRELR